MSIRRSFAALSLVVGIVSHPSWADTSPDAQRAVDALQKAVQSDPNNAELWVHLGFAQQKVDQVDAAAQAFETALSKDPKNQSALYMLGLLYEKQKRSADALRVWRQYLTLATDPQKRSVAESHIQELSR